jgi:hypothetical protein
MAEAAIGLSLIVFVWILITYVNYMCNNRIRTNMAARFSAWLSGNGVNPTANESIASYFFLNNDTNFAMICPSAQNGLTVVGFSLGSLGPIGDAMDLNLCSNSVTFGTNYLQVNANAPFPFDMLEASVPFMPPEMLTNCTLVSGHCAWPNNVSDTYSGFWPFSGGSPVVTALSAYEMAAWYTQIEW